MANLKQLVRAAFVGAVSLGAASAASAVTYDIATSFGASPFSYGKLNTNGTLTAFTACTTVFGTAGYCGASNLQSITTDGAGTVMLHTPSSTPDNTAIFFTAAVSGTYSFSGSAFTADTRSDGVGVAVFNSGSKVETILGVTTPGASNSLDYSVSLNAGDVFVLLFDPFGTNSYDTTYLTGVVTAPAAAAADVPEPASWAMMVGGFGLLGAAMRRRRAAVSFA